MKTIKITPEDIKKLKANEIFVFGSNRAGVHGAGAALIAKKKFGAVDGFGEGLKGKSYALPTKDAEIKTLPLEEIQKHVDALFVFSKTLPENQFLITAVGCGLAGYAPSQIAPMFKRFLALDNVSLPQSFVDILENQVSEVVLGFKGFDQNLKCRDFQYELDKDYEMDGDVQACSRGFHFCEHPLNVFDYYPPASSRFAEVEGSGKIAREQNGDTKVAVSRLRVLAEISLESLTKAAVKFVLDRVKSTESTTNAEDNQGAASNSGDHGAASNSGYQGAASNSGTRGAASNSGDHGAASNSGYQGAASNSGYQGAASNSGYQGAASNSGTRGAASNSGKQGVSISLGIDGKAKSSIGGWITIAEWKYENFEWNRIDIQTVKVDGEIIKDDTFYKLIDGKFVEAE